MSAVLELLKSLIAKESARLVAYGGTLLLAGAVKLASMFGLELSPEIQLGLNALGVLIATEVIRRLVWSKNTHEKEIAALIGAHPEADPQ